MRALRFRPRALVLVLLLALPAAGSGAALAAGLPEPGDIYVNDFANVLSEAEEDLLRQDLARLRADSLVHGVVTTIRSPQDYGGPETLPDFTTALMNAWGPGDRLRNDGFMIVVATDTREIRIGLGAGYEPVWDNRAQRVIDALMVPLLRDERYAEGLRSGVTGMADYVAGPFSQGLRFSATEGMPEAPEDSGGMEDLLVFLGMLLLMGGFILVGNRGALADALARLRPCPSCGHKGIRTEPLPPAEEGSPALIRRFCPSCGWEHLREDTSSVTADGSGSRAEGDRDSGGGFGGGSSSGGGASGRY